MNRFSPKGRVKNVNASVLTPENAGLRIILNFCSLNAKFDDKLDKLLTKRWAKAREEVRGWFSSQRDFKLGQISNCAVGSDTWIVEALVKDKENKLDKVALEAAIKKTGQFCKAEKASLHVSNLLLEVASELEILLQKYVLEEGVNVYFYTEPVKA